ncbi:uncharacterized protein PF3D7_1120000-like [Clytia hemisphaerica]|uniref:uncharacterized protein PF3D7_1120000-like n=1 Tax=Clytia hemisphaerica TaxID=252671 RepID=UPI0034D76F7E
MNEAHSSVDRERAIHEEHRKLKQEIAELRAKYEKETLENKIKTLEMQNEIQTLKHGNEIDKLKAKQEKNEEKADVRLTENALKEENLALKDEIQKLKHELEITKLKADNDKEALKNQIEVLQNQIQVSNETADKLDLKTDVKALRNELETLKTEVRQVARKTKQEVVEKALSGIPDRFFEGAEKFWMDYNTGDEDFSGENYKLWYEDMSRLMKNRKQYVNQKFVLIRKDVKHYSEILLFVCKPEGIAKKEYDHCLIVEGLFNKLPNKANIFLLHPSNGPKCLKTKLNSGNGLQTYKSFYYDAISREFFFGNSYSVIMLGQLK